MERANFVRFVETKRFTALWDSLDLTVEELMNLQDEIAERPDSFPVIPGTSGLRKMRFAPRSLKRGKRGALRVCFAYFEQFSVIVLVLVYAKKGKADVTLAERKALKKTMDQIKMDLRHESGNS